MPPPRYNRIVSFKSRSLLYSATQAPRLLAPFVVTHQMYKLSGVVAAVETVSRMRSYDLNHDADPQQIAALCADLRARAEAADAEQAELEMLAGSPADVRAGQCQQYRTALDQARTRGRRIHLLICRYCEHP